MLNRIWARGALHWKIHGEQYRQLHVPDNAGTANEVSDSSDDDDNGSSDEYESKIWKDNELSKLSELKATADFGSFDRTITKYSNERHSHTSSYNFHHRGRRNCGGKRSSWDAFKSPQDVRSQIFYTFRIHQRRIHKLNLSHRSLGPRFKPHEIDVVISDDE
jgi:hypothetical protein